MGFEGGCTGVLPYIHIYTYVYSFVRTLVLGISFSPDEVSISNASQLSCAHPKAVDALRVESVSGV